MLIKLGSVWVDPTTVRQIFGDHPIGGSNACGKTVIYCDNDRVFTLMDHRRADEMARQVNEALEQIERKRMPVVDSGSETADD